VFGGSPFSASPFSAESGPTEHSAIAELSSKFLVSNTTAASLIGSANLHGYTQLTGSGYIPVTQSGVSSLDNYTQLLAQASIPRTADTSINAKSIFSPAGQVITSGVASFANESYLTASGDRTRHATTALGNPFQFVPVATLMPVRSINFFAACYGTPASESLNFFANCLNAGSNSGIFSSIDFVTAGEATNASLNFYAECNRAYDSGVLNFYALAAYDSITASINFFAESTGATQSILFYAGGSGTGAPAYAVNANASLNFYLERNLAASIDWFAQCNTTVDSELEFYANGAILASGSIDFITPNVYGVLTQGINFNSSGF
jgi:hypothetical protein